MSVALLRPEALELTADGPSLSSVRDWACCVFETRFPEAPAPECHAFVLAVHEAVRNVIEHAYDGWGGVVRIEAASEGRGLRVRLIHSGRPFSGEAPPPDFDGTRDRGLGLYLMERGLTRIGYRTLEDGRQQIELVKELEEEKK